MTANKLKFGTAKASRPQKRQDRKSEPTAKMSRPQKRKDRKNAGTAKTQGPQKRKTGFIYICLAE